MGETTPNGAIFLRHRALSSQELRTHLLDRSRFRYWVTRLLNCRLRSLLLTYRKKLSLTATNRYQYRQAQKMAFADIRSAKYAVQKCLVDSFGTSDREISSRYSPSGMTQCFW